jgi:hypothetical protein
VPNFATLINIDEQLLQMTKEVMTAGALGVAFGRNVWGHQDLTGIISAFKSYTLNAFIQPWKEGFGTLLVQNCSEFSIKF